MHVYIYKYIYMYIFINIYIYIYYTYIYIYTGPQEKGDRRTPVRPPILLFLGENLLST